MGVKQAPEKLKLYILLLIVVTILSSITIAFSMHRVITLSDIVTKGVVSNAEKTKTILTYVSETGVKELEKPEFDKEAATFIEAQNVLIDSVTSISEAQASIVEALAILLCAMAILILLVCYLITGVLFNNKGGTKNEK